MMLIRFSRMPFVEQMLAVEALILLGVARASVRTLPFRLVARWLGRRQTALHPPDETLDQSPDAARVAQAVVRVSGKTPWRSNCLAQAIAGHWMLRRRGIDSFLYLGVGRNAQQHFDAHAWLRANCETILGGPDTSRYAVVGIFANQPRQQH